MSHAPSVSLAVALNMQQMAGEQALRDTNVLVNRLIAENAALQGRVASLTNALDLAGRDVLRLRAELDARDRAARQGERP